MYTHIYTYIKAYGCIIVRTAQDDIHYYDDVYEPKPGSNYELLRTIGEAQLNILTAEEPAC